MCSIINIDDQRESEHHLATCHLNNDSHHKKLKRARSTTRTKVGKQVQHQMFVMPL